MSLRDRTLQRRHEEDERMMKARDSQPLPDQVSVLTCVSFPDDKLEEYRPPAKSASWVMPAVRAISRSWSMKPRIN